MIGLFQRIANLAHRRRPVGKHPALGMGYGSKRVAPDTPNEPLRKFKLEGKVLKDSEAGTEVLASGGCVKEAVSAQALKEAWERDMKIAFPMGADYNVEYHCTVTPLDDEPDEDDDAAVKAAIAAEVGTAMMF